jgi:putative sterol carrier protein
MKAADSQAPAALEAFFRSLEHGWPTTGVFPSDVCIHIQLTGDADSSWTIRTPRGRVEVEQGELCERPDCRMRTSVEDFRGLLSGVLTPRQGFLEGRFDVEGDVGLVLRLQRALIARGRADQLLQLMAS